MASVWPNERQDLPYLGTVGMELYRPAKVRIAMTQIQMKEMDAENNAEKKLAILAQVAVLTLDLLALRIQEVLIVVTEINQQANSVMMRIK